MIERIIEWIFAFWIGVCAGMIYDWISENYEFRKKEAK